MLRRTITGAGVSALLAASLLAASPPPVGAAPEEYKPYGRASAPDQKLRRGCFDGYKVNYVVRPPTNDWSALIQLYAPSGRKLTSILLDENPQDKRGQATFILCRPSVVAGRYKISMNVIYTVGRDRRQGRVAPTYFRLSR